MAKLRPEAVSWGERIITYLIAGVLMFFIGGNGEGDSTQSPDVAPTPMPEITIGEPATDDHAETNPMLELHNEIRSHRGVGPLVMSEELSQAAMAHARWMSQTGRFSHTGEGGSSFADRSRAAGYVHSPTGENIAKGYRSVDSVVRRAARKERGDQEKGQAQGVLHCYRLTENMRRDEGVVCHNSLPEAASGRDRPLSPLRRRAESCGAGSFRAARRRGRNFAGGDFAETSLCRSDICCLICQ